MDGAGARGAREVRRRCSGRNAGASGATQVRRAQRAARTARGASDFAAVTHRRRPEAAGATPRAAPCKSATYGRVGGESAMAAKGRQPHRRNYPDRSVHFGDLGTGPGAPRGGLSPHSHLEPPGNPGQTSPRVRGSPLGTARAAPNPSLTPTNAQSRGRVASARPRGLSAGPPRTSTRPRGLSPGPPRTRHGLAVAAIPLRQGAPRFRARVRASADMSSPGRITILGSNTRPARGGRGRQPTARPRRPTCDHGRDNRRKPP